MTSLENMSNTIRARVAEVFHSVTVVWDNDPQTEFKPDVMNLRAAIQLGEQRQVSTGSVKRFRQWGTLVFQIYNPVGMGDRANLLLLGDVLANFRCRTYSGVTFSTPTQQTVGRDDKFWQINSLCPFYFDILAT